MDITPEIVKTVEVIYVGKTGELGIGNPDGIPSRLADATPEEIAEYGEWLKTLLVKVTDRTHLRCIDGRHTNCNADGSDPEARLSHVSGTGSNLEIALNAESPLVSTFSVEAPLKTKVNTIDVAMTRLTGFNRSAHLGGCGGVKGAIKDNIAIATKPAILKVTEAVMSVPVITDFLKTSYDTSLGERVRANAVSTADMLTESGWDGDSYVAGVQKDNPRGVEDLQTADDKFSGHAEDSIVFIVSPDETIMEDNIFHINLQTIIENAEALAGQRGQEGYTQAVIAGVGKHVAVADRLPSDKTPIFILVSK